MTHRAHRRLGLVVSVLIVAVVVAAVVVALIGRDASLSALAVEIEPTPGAPAERVERNALRDENRLPESDEAVVTLDRPVRVRARRPITLSETETVTLAVAGAYASGTLVLFGTVDGPGHTFHIADAVGGAALAPRAEITFPLPRDFRALARFEVHSAGESFTVEGLHFGKRAARTDLTDSARWLLDARRPVRFFERDGAFVYRFEGLRAEGAGAGADAGAGTSTRAVTVAVEYVPQAGQDTPAARAVQVLVPDAGQRWRVTLRPGLRSYTLRFGPGEVAPDVVEVKIGPAGTRVVAVQAEQQVPTGVDQTLEPLSVEVGQLLHIPHSWWRNPEFELYRWSLYPRILLIDTRSYAIQSSFFARLAYFVEKDGFRGRLLSDTELAGRHDWNAHNYNGEGLAAFYNAAERTSFTLNRHELILRDIAQAHGIIRRVPSGWSPGEGGILSVSQESFHELRALLLIHEVTHGLFYEEPAFQAGVFDYWDRVLSDAERDYWRVLLRSVSYDPTDRYLMVNEFQAYLLQQRLASVRWYMGTRLADRLRAALPREVGWINRFLQSNPNTFYDAAFALNRLLWEEAGFLGADFWSVERVE